MTQVGFYEFAYSPEASTENTFETTKGAHDPEHNKVFPRMNLPTVL
jgi:hypothetical protein